MSATVKKILDPRTLTAAYAQKPSADKFIFSEIFYKPDESIKDDTVRSMYDPADLRPAPANRVGASARVIYPGDASEKIFTVQGSFNVVDLPMDVYQALREPGSYTLQDKGITEIRRVLKKAQDRQRRFRNLFISKALTKGVLYIDNASGEFASSSTGASTVDFQMSSSHQGTCGGLISALWSANSTDIAAQLAAINDQAAKDAKPIPTDIWVNAYNLQYLRNNDYFQEWAKRNPEVNDAILRGVVNDEVRMPLWGKTWHFVSSYYVDSTGTAQPHIPLTGVGSAVFTADPAGDWLFAKNGVSMVPSSIDVVPDVGNVSSIREIVGEYAYAVLDHNPVRLRMFMGDKFFFGFNEPDAVWQATAF